MIDFIKKHKVLTTLIVIVFVLLLIIPILVYVFASPHQNTDELPSTILLYFGSYIAFLGTMSLSVVSIIQTNIANKQNDRLLHISEAEFIPVISIHSVRQENYKYCVQKIKSGKDIPLKNIMTCNVDCTPDDCSAIILEIHNVSKYPISEIQVAIDKYDKHYYRDGKVSTYIAPNQSQCYNICTVGSFGTDKILLTITNTVEYQIKVELDVTDILKGSSNYSYKLVK